MHDDSQDRTEWQGPSHVNASQAVHQISSSRKRYSRVHRTRFAGFGGLVVMGTVFGLLAAGVVATMAWIAWENAEGPGVWDAAVTWLWILGILAVGALIIFVAAVYSAISGGR